MTSCAFVLSAGLLLVSVSALPTFGFEWNPVSRGAKLLEPLKQDLAFPFFNGEKNVNLILYTQSNPDVAERISLSNDSAYPSFNPSHPTRFVIHGWRASAREFYSVRDAYLRTGMDVNVVMVDWSGPAKSDYFVATLYTRRVGEYLARVIRRLEEKKNLSLDLVYVVGHSLGAQTAGVTGNRLQGKLARIVGLDPAAALFHFSSLRNRLDRADARFVQVVHTNGGQAGWRLPLGHADFFPNGGSRQPGCGLEILAECSHVRATALFVESIASKQLIGTRCESYARFRSGRCDGNPQAIMGEWTPSSTRGNFYLKTKSEPPYADVE